jgi:hypothetical protein
MAKRDIDLIREINASPNYSLSGEVIHATNGTTTLSPTGVVQDIVLNGVTFHGHLTLSNIKTKGKIVFINCTFNGNLAILNCNLEFSKQLDNLQSIHFKNCAFDGKEFRVNTPKRDLFFTKERRKGSFL